MNNPFYSALAGKTNNNLAVMLRQVKSNPIQFLAQKRLNIPQSIANDPNAILQHLVSSGQVTQSQINAAFQMGKQFKGM